VACIVGPLRRVWEMSLAWGGWPMAPRDLAAGVASTIAERSYSLSPSPPLEGKRKKNVCKHSTATQEHERGSARTKQRKINLVADRSGGGPSRHSDWLSPHGVAD
jgi:hypothetical protein